MTEIMELVGAEQRILFGRVFVDVETKLGLITCFLAVLELIRLHKLLVFQQNVFGDIYLERVNTV